MNSSYGVGLVVGVTYSGFGLCDSLAVHVRVFGVGGHPFFEFN